MHTYTYPELALLTESITSSEGHTFKPVDLRKGYAFFWHEKDQQQQPVSLWSAWQRSVQAASRRDDVSQKVMDYFQLTKGLSKPPVKGDKSLLGEALEPVFTTYGEAVVGNPPAEASAVLARQAQETLDHIKQSRENLTKPAKPLFATSYSGMQLFELCPNKWAAEKWYKTVPYEEGEAAKWGNRVHLAFENTLKGRPTADDTKLLTDQGWLKYATAMLKAEGDLSAERELCLTEDLQPCGWKDWNTVWFRLKADVLLRKEKTLKYFDFKSGKKKEDPFQIEVTWAVASQHFPGVEEFDGKLLFLKDPAPIWGPGVLTRADLPRIWDKIFTITNRMKEAVKNENFRMQKNGLCRQYCGNTACPHCGRR